MPRPSKIWYWKARREWYVKVNGVRHRLGPDKKAAQQRFHELMASPQKQIVPSDSVAAILDRFLDWTKENRAPKTHRGYQDFCQSFLAKHPSLRMADLTTEHVTDWLATQDKWNSTTKRGAITALQRAFNWAVKNIGMDKNPIRGMDKPEAKTRTTVVSPDEFSELLANIPDAEFRELLIVSYDCGSRPQEVKSIEARHVSLSAQCWILPTEEAKGKRRPRTVYIPTERSLGIIRRRIKEYPKGPIFRNTIGNSWTASAVKCRFAKLEEKMGKRYFQYAFRHSWITRKLLAGVDSHVVAALAGHSDSGMIDRVYSHVAEDHKYMLEAAKKDITPSDSASDAP